MQLTQTEIIQILRKRAGLNQAELGSRAFNTTFDSGRTKIKNIELGKQRVTEKDLADIAECLNVPVEQLQPSSGSNNFNSEELKDGIIISRKIIDMFPELREYLEMLEKAAIINDLDLIDYLSKKIADIWQHGPQGIEPSPKKITSAAKRRIDRG